jgi:hypothetical protein
MFATVELFYGTQGKRERKRNDRASVIPHTIRCEGTGYKGAYCKLLKNGAGGNIKR